MAIPGTVKYSVTGEQVRVHISCPETCCVEDGVKIQPDPGLVVTICGPAAAANATVAVPSPRTDQPCPDTFPPRTTAPGAKLRRSLYLSTCGTPILLKCLYRTGTRSRTLQYTRECDSCIRGGVRCPHLVSACRALCFRRNRRDVCVSHASKTPLGHGLRCQHGARPRRNPP